MNCSFVIGGESRDLNQILRGELTELSLIINNLWLFTVLHIDMPELYFIGVIQQIRK